MSQYVNWLLSLTFLLFWSPGGGCEMLLQHVVHGPGGCRHPALCLLWKPHADLTNRFLEKGEMNISLLSWRQEPSGPCSASVRAARRRNLQPERTWPDCRLINGSQMCWGCHDHILQRVVPDVGSALLGKLARQILLICLDWDRHAPCKDKWGLIYCTLSNLNYFAVSPFLLKGLEKELWYQKSSLPCLQFGPAPSAALSWCAWETRIGVKMSSH